MLCMAFVDAMPPGFQAVAQLYEDKCDSFVSLQLRAGTDAERSDGGKQGAEDNELRALYSANKVALKAYLAGKAKQPLRRFRPLYY